MLKVNVGFMLNLSGKFDNYRYLLKSQLKTVSKSEIFGPKLQFSLIAFLWSILLLDHGSKRKFKKFFDFFFEHC